METSGVLDRQQAALVGLGRLLRAADYQFVTATPATHARVNARVGNARGRALTDIFGWSRPFAADALPQRMLAQLETAGAIVVGEAGLLRSTVRFSTLGPLLLVHSAFPTDTADAVFFGPDSYRFAHAVRAAADHGFTPRVLIDIGAGSGAGALCAAAAFPSLGVLLLGDINQQALRFAAVNAVLNNVAGAVTRCSDVLAQIPERADLIVSNPPYLYDGAGRLYRHGGGEWGCTLGLRIAAAALDQLTATGKLLLYTGAPVVDGRDLFHAALQPLLDRRTTGYRYEELDPDVFGEELDTPPYSRADRIAAVLLTVHASQLRRT